MKQSSRRPGRPGYVSYALVITTGAILTLLLLSTYRRAATAQDIQSKVQLRIDYSEKEDAILRSVVAITPNRAIRAMQNNSNSSNSISNPLRWQDIFTEALVLANARTSINPTLKTSLGITDLKTGNSGDSALATPSTIFKALNSESGYVSPGINRSLGTGFPPALSSGSSTTNNRDSAYPIITSDKIYGNLAQSGVGLPVATYPNFNLLTYPRINFGYAKPGDPFVAKRNWWAFSMDVGAQDAATTKLARPGRNFVLSLYEIPSQLSISASSFMSLGKFASGSAWKNVTIGGGVFGGKIDLDSTTPISAISGRRGVALAINSTVGGLPVEGNPFTPGVRESYQLTQGEFFPVSLASESGRVAFVAINRGADYFDRHAHSPEANTVSPTSWNNYSIGALQCAMRLDVTKVVSSSNKTPTEFEFSYLKGGVRQTQILSTTTTAEAGLPPGYIYACSENQTYNFGNAVVDVAYGKAGGWAYQTGVTGSVTFNNARFGDPNVGTFKWGYFRPSYAHQVKTLPSGQICVAIYPQRIPSLLTALNADGPAVNNSLVVNADYTRVHITKPQIPCTSNDYGLILQECANLSPFPKGFSLVTNLRIYVGDDFNVTPGTPPTGYSPTGTYYPPCSIFTPEKRYGVEGDPYFVNMAGQVGSLAAENIETPIRPLDSRGMSGADVTPDRLTVNLRPITHPADLPPITMMNWLIHLEERRKEFW